MIGFCTHMHRVSRSLRMSEKSNRLRQSGCVFRFYCGSTVWPASQCNPQTIPCCYSITRSAVQVPLQSTFLFLLQSHSLTSSCRRLLQTPDIYLPKTLRRSAALFGGEAVLHLKHKKTNKTKQLSFIKVRLE